MNRCFILASVLLVLAACASTLAPTTDTVLPIAQIDTLPGGAVRVRNSGGTRWADTTGWRFTLESTIAPADNEPGSLGVTDGIAVDASGSVYALQRKPAEIFVFDSAGTWVRTIGKEGSGPGDIRSGSLAVHGDTLIVQQPNDSRLSFFLTSGKYLSSFRSACCMLTPQMNVDSTGNIWVPGSMLVDGRPGWALLNFSGKKTSVVAEPSDSGVKWPSKVWTAPAMMQGREVTAMIRVPLATRVISVPRSDGIIVFGRNDRNALVLSRTGRDSVGVIEFPSPPIALSDVEKDSIVRAAVARFNGPQSSIKATITGKVGDLADLPSSWPAWSNLSVDRENRIWVGIGGGRGELTRLIVFSPDGVMLGEVPPPDPRFFEGAWGPRGRLVVPGEKEDGTPMLRVYLLRMNDAR